MKNKSKQRKKAKKICSYEYEFSEESVSSFGGLSLTEHLANRLGLWKSLQDQVPGRQGKYERIDIIRGAVNGLLSGSRGTASLSEIAEDEALLKLLGIKGLPGEKLFWEELERLGTDRIIEALNEGLAKWACKLLKRCNEEEWPTLDRLEAEKLYYVIGANKLQAAQEVLDKMPQWQWQDVPQSERRGDSDAGQTCVAWVQCAGWPEKRLLVGKRFKRTGELIWNTVSVITNLPAARLQESSQNDPGFARKVWQLYSSKMGMKNYFKDVLIDLSGHRVPCNKLAHNRGYYALLGLAYNLSRGVDLIGGKALREEKREQAKTHKRAPAKWMRIWNLRRKLFSLPARIIVHARKASLQILGGGRSNWKLFESYWKAIALC